VGHSFFSDKDSGAVGSRTSLNQPGLKTWSQITNPGEREKGILDATELREKKPIPCPERVAKVLNEGFLYATNEPSPG